MLTYIGLEYYDEYHSMQKEECNLAYDDHLRLSNETFYSNVGQVQKIVYEYRTNLNYYTEVQSTYTYSDGATLYVQKMQDNLNRTTYVRTINNETGNGMQINIAYFSRATAIAGTTNYVGSWRYSTVTNGAVGSALRTDGFAYDANGNITMYGINDGAVSTIGYVYDEANRLVRENNQKLGRTYVYKYDARGNIVGKKEYSYTTASNLTATQNNTYDTADRLLNWNGLSFSYDKCGNPTRYKGTTMSWERGRLLKSYKNVDFVYDGSGERFTKTVNGVTTRYITFN